MEQRQAGDEKWYKAWLASLPAKLRAVACAPVFTSVGAKPGQCLTYACSKCSAVRNRSTFKKLPCKSRPLAAGAETRRGVTTREWTLRVLGHCARDAKQQTVRERARAAAKKRREEDPEGRLEDQRVWKKRRSLSKTWLDAKNKERRDTYKRKKEKARAAGL